MARMERTVIEKVGDRIGAALGYLLGFSIAGGLAAVILAGAVVMVREILGGCR